MPVPPNPPDPGTVPHGIVAEDQFFLRAISRVALRIDDPKNPISLEQRPTSLDQSRCVLDESYVLIKLGTDLEVSV